MGIFQGKGKGGFRIRLGLELREEVEGDEGSSGGGHAVELRSMQEWHRGHRRKKRVK